MQGNDSEKVLQRLCANDLKVANGKIVYTAMLNNRGGIEADLTITKLLENQYMIVTGPGVSNRDFHWIKNHINCIHVPFHRGSLKPFQWSWI